MVRPVAKNSTKGPILVIKSYKCSWNFARIGWWISQVRMQFLKLFIVWSTISVGILLSNLFLSILCTLYCYCLHNSNILLALCLPLMFRTWCLKCFLKIFYRVTSPIMRSLVKVRIFGQTAVAMKEMSSMERDMDTVPSDAWYHQHPTLASGRWDSDMAL